MKGEGDLDDVGEAGALVRVQRLVHPVGQPRCQHAHLPMVPPVCFFALVCFFLCLLGIVPFCHYEDPTIVSDPLWKCVQIAPNEQDVTFAKISSGPRHIDFLVLQGNMSIFRDIEGMPNNLCLATIIIRVLMLTTNPSMLPIMLPSSKVASFDRVFSITCTIIKVTLYTSTIIKVTLFNSTIIKVTLYTSNIVLMIKPERAFRRRLCSSVPRSSQSARQSWCGTCAATENQIKWMKHTFGNGKFSKVINNDTPGVTRNKINHST